MGIRARVADVHKALLSVAEVVDKGFRVVFDTDQKGRDISHMVRKSDGQRVEFRRRNKVYEIDWDILPYQPAPEDTTVFSRATDSRKPDGNRRVGAERGRAAPRLRGQRAEPHREQRAAPHCMRAAGSTAPQRAAGRAALRAAGKAALRAAGSTAQKGAGSTALRAAGRPALKTRGLSTRRPCRRNRQ